MKFLQKYWFLILIIAIGIFVLYRILTKKEISIVNPPNSNSSSNNGIFGNIGTAINNTVGTIIPPTIKTNNFVYGDKIYANENNVNTYKSASATSSNLDSYTQYNKDNLIGTFVEKSGIFSKLLITTPTAHHVYVLSNQIFSK